MNTAQDLRNKFRAMFDTSPTICRAPGRVNLIGEHTDYNDGFVLPAAIGFSCWTATAARKDRRITVYSENLSQSVVADLDGLDPLSETAWANYPLGVARALEQAGNRLSGAELYFAGEVPLGSGLSSSAAIELSTGLALLTDLFVLVLAFTRLGYRFVAIPVRPEANPLSHFRQPRRVPYISDKREIGSLPK
jgi:galactokinase